MSPGRLFVIGLGPGDRGLLTEPARDALTQSSVVIGYTGYFPWVADLVEGKECLALPLTQETERARLAVQNLRAGQTVCVISSGDPGVYGMASLVLECLEKAGEEELLGRVAILPGVSAVNAAAALLGAPLGHDFAVISLSDLLTPWAQIERRLRAAADGDFVVALLNPRSQRRDWQLRRAKEILMEKRSPQTPVGLVRNACRPGQAVTLTTLARLGEADVDMFTTVIVGSSQTRRFGPVLVTPRGYVLYDKSSEPSSPLSPQGRGAGGEGKMNPEAILAESFRIIESEVGAHPFGPEEWPVVRRMIHASGDVDLVRSVHIRPGAVAAGIQAFRVGAPVVTDVRMVAAGISCPSLEALGVQLHCWIDDPEVRRTAQEEGQTRSYLAMKRAAAAFPEAVFVIGNAPTALLALCEAVRTGVARPRLVIALPVGFVAVTESKEAALALDVPVLTVRGRKGGSALAAAAVNALLLLARGGPSP